MILVCVCICVCGFIKLHVTTQSGPVILVILYAIRINSPKAVSMMHITITSDQTRQSGSTFSTYAVLFFSLCLSLSVCVCIY